MFKHRPLQIALFTLALGSFAISAWLKGYMIDHQTEWGGRPDIIRVIGFGDFSAPATVGYSYIAACLASVVCVALLAISAAKRK